MEIKKNLFLVLKAIAQVTTCVFFYALLWVFATPICFSLLKNLKTKLRIGLQVIIFALLFYFAGFITFWIVLMPALTVELAIQTVRHRQVLKNYQNQIILLSAVALFHLSLYIIFDSFNSDEINLQLSMWFDQIQTYFDKMSLRVGSQTQSYKLIKQSWIKIIDFVPSIYFGGFVLGYYSCFWRSRLLSSFKCLDSFFWLTLFSFSLGFLNWASYFEFLSKSINLDYLEAFLTYQSLFKNIFLVFCSMYFFQGLSVSLYFMEKLKITRFWQNVWYILIIFNLPMIIAAIGIFDFLFELRVERKVEPRSFKEKK